MISWFVLQAPVVPNPANCPCFLVSPTGKNSASETSPTTPPTPSPAFFQPHPGVQHNQISPYGIIGYIPVIFYPFCNNNGTVAAPVGAPPMFPAAFSVPYPCSQCGAPANSQAASTLPQLLSGRTSFEPVGKTGRRS